MEPLTEQTLGQIAAFAGTVTKLREDIGIEWRILDNTGDAVTLKGMWKVEAPYYLVVFSEKKPGFECNCGYLLEQIVLYLASKGIGSCFIGGSQIRGLEITGMVQTVPLAFGLPEGPLYREASTARRLPLKELCVFREEAGESVKTVLKAARLAPSSMNTQPWRFLVYRDRIVVFMCRDRFSGLTRLSLGQYNMGIAMSHMMLAAEELWMEFHIVNEENLSMKKYKHGEYFTTVILN